MTEWHLDDPEYRICFLYSKRMEVVSSKTTRFHENNCKGFPFHGVIFPLILKLKFLLNNKNLSHIAMKSRLHSLFIKTSKSKFWLTVLNFFQNLFLI